MLRENVSLQSYNTLAVPSVAERFVCVEHAEELPMLLEQARLNQWPITVLAGGSNVVLAEHLPGLVIQQACLGIDIVEDSNSSVLVSVAAGVEWHGFLRWCLEKQYHGLENLALIPGSVGAAPIQNIGAYGVEVAGFIDSVHCRWLDSAEPFALSSSECQFAYRDSFFKGELAGRVIIESVRFRLHKSFHPEISYPSLARWLEEQGIGTPDARQLFDAVVAVRQARLPDPAQVPNVGSFFKNPQVQGGALEQLLSDYPELPHYADASLPGAYKLAAAWLIEQCGFKRAQGKVRVHPDHALVIINPERAGASAIRDFADEIKAAVKQRFALDLVQEPSNCG